ncbi:MAG: FMN-binding protein, partial [Spirochaetaceae bacterium]|nr:FMN-binding protein [Spirochaetaceae bacterium]
EGVNRAVVGGRDVMVKQFQGNGLWGTITGVLAVDSSLSQIIGLDVISHSETPGLGGRIEEDWFKDQFREEQIGPDGITVRKGEGGVDDDKENSTVDGITGASLTSAAMEVIINNEIEYLRQEAAK